MRDTRINVTLNLTFLSLASIPVNKCFNSFAVNLVDVESSSPSFASIISISIRPHICLGWTFADFGLTLFGSIRHITSYKLNHSIRDRNTLLDG